MTQKQQDTNVDQPALNIDMNDVAVDLCQQIAKLTHENAVLRAVIKVQNSGK